jgi:sulfite reductase beta subunit-like hemoprotein
VENGRIADREAHRLKSGIRALVDALRPGITLTANQNILFTDLTEDAIPRLEQTLVAHGVQLPDGLSAARRYSMACVALPTCGLAMAESERLMPSVVDRFEAELDRLGLRDEPLTLRMTGCPNGCARPYTADIAFVGKAPDVYHVFVGGGLSGSRLADLYAKSVPTEQLVEVLRPLLSAWAAKRHPGEDLSSFYQRHMPDRPARQILTGKEDPTATLVQLELNK